MAKEKTTVDEAATAVLETLEKVAAGKSEAALAKILIVSLALAAGTPWLVAAEPLLLRLLERLNNKAGKDAVAEIAKEVETEEGFNRIASQVMTGQVEPVLHQLFAQQTARSGIQIGTFVETVQGSVEDAVARIGILLHRLEERNGRLTHSREPLVMHRVLTGPTTSMRCASRIDQRRFEEVRAARYDAQNLRLMLELTNMSKVDVRPLALNLDVVNYFDIDVEDVWCFLGLMRPIRKYGVTLEARTGRFPCVSLDDASDGEYLVIPPGGLEVFSILITVPPREGLYVVRPALQCSSGGETFVQEFEGTATFGVYDPEQHTPVQDERRRAGPPVDDGGDNCVSEAHAVAMAVAGRAARLS
jgi:hypothetical protein